MNLKNVALSLALVGGTAFVTATVVSQDKPAGDHGMPDMTLCMPGEHHKALDKFVGTWNDDLKHWMDPNSEPGTMQGTTESKWILDGHYLMGHFKGEYEGMPFEGIEIRGYDNMRNEYFTIWLDSMGTGYSISKGNMKDGKMVMHGTTDDPMSNMKDIKTRSVGTELSDGKMKFEMFAVGPDGKEVKTMEIISTRKN